MSFVDSKVRRIMITLRVWETFEGRPAWPPLTLAEPWAFRVIPEDLQEGGRPWSQR